MSAGLIQVICRSGRSFANGSRVFRPCVCTQQRSKFRTFHAVLGSSKGNDDNKLGQCTIILQDGLDIQEVPAVVKKINGFENVSEEVDDACGYFDKEVSDAFNRCSNKKGVFLLFETIPKDEATPFVALQALRRLVELEANQLYRNSILYDENIDLFCVEPVCIKIYNTILGTSQADILIDTLRLFCRMALFSDLLPYRDRIRDQILLKTAEGKLSLQQICEAAKVLASFKDLKNDVDKLWPGILGIQNDIAEDNVVNVFRILPFLSQSRNMVLKILEKKLENLWLKLPGSTMAEILSVFLEVKLQPVNSLNIIARWTNTNIHVVSEDDLLQIVKGFCLTDYTSTLLQNALERYVKAKSLKVRNAALMTTIADYCLKFRLRNVHILQGFAEYFIQYGKQLSPVQVRSLFLPLAFLDYRPTSGWKFWKVLEEVIANNFAQFRPEDIVDVLLSCIYQEKYPVNFVRHIFTPFFLDRLNDTKNINRLLVTKSQLVLFDAAMALECPQYSGPFLPRVSSSMTVWHDSRVKRAINIVYDTLADICGSIECISTSVLLPQMPPCELYVVDLLLHPRGISSSLLRFNMRNNRNVFVALLIHPPEHYCSLEETLIGPQVMRKRQLRKLGLKVASLNLSQLAKLKVHPKNLHEYVEEALRMAEEATES